MRGLELWDFEHSAFCPHYPCEGGCGLGPGGACENGVEQCCTPEVCHGAAVDELIGSVSALLDDIEKPTRGQQPVDQAFDPRAPPDMIDAKGFPWRDYKPGIKAHQLAAVGEFWIYLMRLDPGACVPWEIHAEREHVELLDGAEVQVTVHAPGTAANGVNILHRGDGIDIPTRAEHKIESIDPLLTALLLVIARPDFGGTT